MPSNKELNNLPARFYYSESKREWVDVQKMNVHHLRNALRKQLMPNEAVLLDELVRRFTVPAKEVGTAIHKLEAFRLALKEILSDEA